MAVSNLTLTGGTDRAYTAGAKVEITPTARYAKDLYDWAMTGHNQNGTHKAFTEANIVPTTAIQDSAVTSAKIANTSVTGAKLDFGSFVGVQNDSTNLSSLVGLKVMTGWGQFLGNGTGSQSVAVTLPSGFTTAPYCVIVKLNGYKTSGTLTSLKSIDNSIGYQFDVSTPIVSNTGFTANFTTSASYGAAYHGFSWIAIGI